MDYYYGKSSLYNRFIDICINKGIVRIELYGASPDVIGNIVIISIKQDGMRLM